MLDHETLNSTLASSLERLLPASLAICNKTNTVLSSTVAMLFDPIKLFVDKYTEQQLAAAAADTRVRTRGVASERSTEPLHIQACRELVRIMREIDDKIREEKTSEFLKDFKTSTLTATQRSRTFSRERHDMLERACRICLFCQMASMNSVPENDTAANDNKTKQLNYCKEAATWKSWKDEADKELKKGNPAPPHPINPVTKKTMKQNPKKPTFQPIIEMCMCRNSQCVQRGSDIGSTCFIKCIDPSSGQRYPWDEITGQCTCPVCQCQCPAAYNIQDRNKIALSITKVMETKILDELDSSNNDPEEGLRRFIRRASKGGALLATAAEKEIPAGASEEHRTEIVTEAIMEGTAVSMARDAHLLPTNSRQLLQGQFGQSTEVTLPGGQRLDTRMLGTDRVNMHSNNNRLGAATSTAGLYLPGMVDHQRPSYESVSEKFLQASKEPPIVNAFLGPFFGELDDAAAATSQPAAAGATGLGEGAANT